MIKRFNMHYVTDIKMTKVKTLEGGAHVRKLILTDEEGNQTIIRLFAEAGKQKNLSVQSVNGRAVIAKFVTSPADYFQAAEIDLAQ